MRRYERRILLKGSFTVEMSVIAPLILFLVLGCILTFFYYHDKNILAGAAYETAAAGSIKAREAGGTEASELEVMFRERIRGKCILFANGQARVEITDDDITVHVTASRKRMKVSLVYRAAVTEPEQQIRARNRLTDRKE